MHPSDTGRLGVTQTIAFTGSSVAITNAFSDQTRVIRLVADASCCFSIGDGVQTATQSSPYLPANWEAHFTVSPGQRISAIRAATEGLVTATSGTLWVSEYTG